MKINVFLNHYKKRLFVGFLTENKDATNIAFEYDSEFLKTGIHLSPYMLPLKPIVFIENKFVFDGLFGLFNDSLPDGWGLLLLNRSLQSQGLSINQLTPLIKLSMMGTNAIGALEYEPVFSSSMKDLNIFDALSNLDELAQESLSILEKEEIYKNPKIIEKLLQLNGSLAGARPKILVNIHDEDWIIKFRSQNDPFDIGPIEYEYSKLARLSGLDFPDTHLFPSSVKNSSGYFGVKRFDRSEKGKIHVHSASGLFTISHRLPSFDYENLIKLTKNITKNNEDVEKIVRLMIFNVKFRNRDDHSKNFSFIMDKNYAWHFSPVYDLTPTLDNSEHCAMVNNKGKNISDADLLKTALIGGLKKEKILSILDEITTVARDFENSSIPENSSLHFLR